MNIVKAIEAHKLATGEVGQGGAEDPLNLQFSAQEGRILLTHDKRLVPFVLDRIDSGERMPGVFIAQRHAPIGTVVEDVLDLALFSLEGEWEGQILILPLR